MLFPLAKFYFRKGHEEGFKERCGVYSPAKLKAIGEGGLWIHAVSVGEVQAAYPIVRMFRQKGYTGPIILSTVTVTGRTMAEKLIDVPYTHLFAPWDAPQYVHRALDTIKPWAYITLETELWPNILAELKRRGVASYLANARVSDRALRRASGWRGHLLSALFDAFTKLYAREEEDFIRLVSFGLKRGKIRVVGDCKIDALLLRKKKADGDVWKERLGITENKPRRVLLAASTHAGEERIVLDIFARLVRAGFSDIRLILVPRHPERAGEVRADALPFGQVALLSESKKDWDILVVDQIGVLFELYSVAHSAFVGGSLVPKGGQNLLEPACWGIPILHGPYMDDFALPTRELDDLGVAFFVRDAFALLSRWTALLEQDNVSLKLEMHAKSNLYFENKSGAAEAIFTDIAQQITIP